MTSLLTKAGVILVYLELVISWRRMTSSFVTYAMQPSTSNVICATWSTRCQREIGFANGATSLSTTTCLQMQWIASFARIWLAYWFLWLTRTVRKTCSVLGCTSHASISTTRSTSNRRRAQSESTMKTSLLTVPQASFLTQLRSPWKAMPWQWKARPRRKSLHIEWSNTKTGPSGYQGASLVS